MDSNRLVEGETRVGFLEHEDANLPLLTARLEKTSKEIRTTIAYPWGDEVDRRIERWFSGDARWGDDPEKTQFEYAPPTELDFVDNRGSVALIGCRPVGGTMFATVNEGRIAVRFAVLGGHEAKSYRTINGLRSEVEGLGSWMNLRSLKVDLHSGPEGHLHSATLTLESPENVAVSRELNLRISPAFRFGPGEHPDETVITERMLIETDVRYPRLWADHLELHVGMRDLVRVASWRSVRFLNHEAVRDSDQLRTLDGTSHGRQWLPVETRVTDMTHTPSKVGHLDYLFTFDQIGSPGVGRWLRLRRDWARAVDPILGLLNLEKAPLGVHFAQLCIGLEALGYLLAIEDGVAPRPAGQQTFRTRLERIVNHARYPIPFDAGTWVDSATNAYRQVKHADNPEPDPTQMYRAYYQGIHVFRGWVASRLRVPTRAFAVGQSRDRIARMVTDRD